MFTVITLIMAGLSAGALNAVAGGGTFLSFPALVWAGVPPVTANATATLAALPGYLGSAWAFRNDIRASRSLPLAMVLGTAGAGGILGALLLLMTPAEVFEGVVPWLLAFATLVFAFGPKLSAWLASKGVGNAGPVLSAVVLLSVTTYGGYFNGGVGILLLASFGLLGLSDLKEMNGLKNLASSALSLVSVVIYIGAGLIAWQHAIVLGAACAAGGYLGAAMSRQITNPGRLRIFITAVGAAMSLIFFLK